MNDSRTILIAEDDVGMREGLSRSLRREGFTVTLASDGLQALDRLRERTYRMVITDLEMPQVKGIEVLREVKKQSPAVPVVVITAYGSIGTAVEAMKEGAFDFLTKPFSSDALRDVVHRACTDRADLSPPSPARSAAQESGGSLSGSKKLVCSSAGMDEILELARTVAPSKASVLIQGESGTGKELLARYIHQASPRAQRPFVAFNCAAIPESLLESELFGHEKGAFTGANQRKAGRFEQADGGTLLLDEISEMDHKLQAKLLRVLQEQAVDRVGGKDPVSIDVRVIATTNRDLPQSIRQGGFREDLYYRLNVIPIWMPSLREHPDSIEALALHFIEVACLENGRETLRLTPAVLSRLMGYAWPGNIRQLENVLARAVILAKGDEIGEDLMDLTSSDLPLTEVPVAVSSGQTVREMERSLILKTLETTSGNRTKAAESLGISLRTLRNKLNEYRQQGSIGNLVN